MIKLTQGKPGQGMTFTACPPLAHQRSGDSLAAPAEAGQGAGSDMLRGELSHPIGFWVTCHDMLAFLPSDVVRQERRA